MKEDNPMSLVTQLNAFGASIARLMAGTALGLGLIVTVAAMPARALAQDATVAPATPPAAVLPAEGAGPALWVVKDSDSTLYLFGTVHALRPTTGWATARVDAAFDSADEVWLEIVDGEDTAALAPVIQQFGLSPDRPLSSLLNAEEMAELDAAAKTIGASAAGLDPMRPWLAGLSIGIAPILKAGYAPGSGADSILKARATSAGKPLKAFETAEEQIRVLAGLTEETQLDFLRTTLEDYESATTDLDALVVAWASGDVDGVERLGVEELKAESDEVYQALIVNRNNNWANQIETMLKGSGTAFIAVGAAHLAGDESVQAMLAERGIVATRE